jgi:hypothetical protein
MKPLFICYHNHMSFTYVTGAPGSGKSTLQKELSTRGLEVYDIDDPQLGGAYNKASGKRVVIPPAPDRAPDWFDEHEWRIDRGAMSKLKNRATNETIIVCGVAPDDGDILDLFDKIFYLKLDETSLKNRIGVRTDNDYGKNPGELAHILDRKRALDARYGNSVAIVIDATLNPRDIADKVLPGIK